MLITFLCLGLAFFTSIVSGIFGMAGGLILMGGLGYLLSVPSAMLTHGSAQIWANGIRAYTLRKEIYRRGLTFYVAGSLIGGVGLYLLALVPDKGWLFLGMGLVPYFSLFLKRFHLNFQKDSHALICGMGVTGLQILAGVAGPLLDVFFVRTQLNRHQIVATKAVTQVLSHLLKVIYYFRLAQEAPHEVETWFYLAVIPSALLGTRIGISVLNRLTDSQFLRWTRQIVLLLGAIYFLQGLVLLIGV